MNYSSPFVNIKTVFKQTDLRNIENLRLLYNDLEYLKSIINDVTENFMKPETIEGKRVLLKPNWVLHNRKVEDEICMRTHDNFLLAALEVVLIKNPASVLIGDAPIQGCDWDKIIRPQFIIQVERLSRKYKIPVKIKDFRRVTFNPKTNNLTEERNPLSDYIIFDLGKQSLLEPISNTGKNLFRVTDYDPDRLAESHKPGMHKYCITKDLFESEVIITIPKVKTHQKAGITNALKILVGINGDKDFLPHHRKGSEKNGGDCYPGKNILLGLSENVIDEANRHRGNWMYKPLVYLSLLFWKFSLPSPKHNLGAAWHGNDTTWRMTLDLNLIAGYGRNDGTFADNPQRVIYSLSDGIIGGQGDGPLNADPLPLGIICFSNSAAKADAVIATFMGFQINKIPLIFNALKKETIENSAIILNGVPISIDDLKNISIKTTPPPGWLDYL